MGYLLTFISKFFLHCAVNQLTIHINRISSLLIFVQFCHFLTAQDVFNNPYNFQKLDFSINQYKMKALAQQKNSFLWIGTDNGLHRFDGQNIKQYSFVSWFAMYLFVRNPSGKQITHMKKESLSRTQTLCQWQIRLI